MADEWAPLSIGRPTVVLPAPDPRLVQQIVSATRLDQVAAIVSDHPDSMDAWAALGHWYERSEGTLVDAVAAYGCFRVGYHRGLDALRRNGWNGSQSVRWEDEPNRGFLRCVSGLARMAERLGELPEAERCAGFLIDLDPDWMPEPAG